jgi:putative transposase
VRERKRTRLKGFDYISDSFYFVTSMVHGRICCFGEISDGTMILNEFGQIAVNQWFWLPHQYPYVKLHAFVVMPDHIHGIIQIDRVGDGRDRPIVGDDRIMIGDGRDRPLRCKIKSLSEIMGAYKTTVSKKIHVAGNLEFAWQRSFHDHIIRDDKEFILISRYIINNPLNWGK